METFLVDVLRTREVQRLRRVRQLGLKRILFGSDGAISGNTPQEHWTRFRQLPLSDAEFRTIESNIAP